MTAPETFPNPDLEVIEGNKRRWTHADHRRHGFHNLHRIARYVTSLRAARVMRLEKRFDLSIADLEPVRHLASLPSFSGMIVIRGQHILFERYAPDFDKGQPHSVQSITKMLVNLIMGGLVEDGTVDLDRRISDYIPEIGTGYASATVQQTLDMDVVNEYSEDFTDPSATYYFHEEAMGWRLPREAGREELQRTFLRRISSSDTTNRSGFAQYKDANSDVLGWVIERASGRSLRAYLADIADAAGLEGALHITTDREGVPTMDGGACLTARDLARLLSIFVRRGRGIGDERVGSKAFIERTLASGVPLRTPYDGIRYSNHLMVSGRSVGHAGWGGQYAVADLETGIIGVFLSVMEDEHAATRTYLPPVSRMLRSITAA